MMGSPHNETVFLAHISADGTREQTVQEHLLGTADLAAQFARPFHAEEQARLAGLLHDIGKYTAGFQRRLHGGQKVDHSTAGMQQALALRQPAAAFAIAGHHGGLPDGGAKTDDACTATLLGRNKRPPARGLQPLAAGAPAAASHPAAPAAAGQPERILLHSHAIFLPGRCRLPGYPKLYGRAAPAGRVFHPGCLAGKAAAVHTALVGCPYRVEPQTVRDPADLPGCRAGLPGRSVHADGAHRRRKDRRLAGICPDPCGGPRQGPGHLCDPLHLHHRPDRRSIPENSRAGKCGGAPCRGGDIGAGGRC